MDKPLCRLCGLRQAERICDECLAEIDRLKAQLACKHEWETVKRCAKCGLVHPKRK